MRYINNYKLDFDQEITFLPFFLFPFIAIYYASINRSIFEGVPYGSTIYLFNIIVSVFFYAWLTVLGIYSFILKKRIGEQRRRRFEKIKCVVNVGLLCLGSVMFFIMSIMAFLSISIFPCIRALVFGDLYPDVVSEFTVFFISTVIGASIFAIMDMMGNFSECDFEFLETLLNLFRKKPKSL